MINGIIDSTNGATIVPALATGNIKKYQLVVATLLFLNLPISYVALKLGCDATYTIIISIAISIIAVITRAILLKQMIVFYLRSYLILMFKILISTLICLYVLTRIKCMLSGGFLTLLVIVISSTLMLLLLYLLFICNKDDRERIFQFIKNYASKIGKKALSL